MTTTRDNYREERVGIGTLRIDVATDVRELQRELAMGNTVEDAGDPDGWQSLDIEILWMMESEAKYWVAAAKETLATIRRLMLRDVDANGSIRLGDAAYVSKPSEERVLVEGMEDTVLDVLELVGMLRNAIKPKDVGITLMRQAFRRKVEEELNRTQPGKDWTEEDVAAGVRLLEGTFYEMEPRPKEKTGVEGRELSIISTSAKRAPQWIGRLSHGQRRNQ